MTLHFKVQKGYGEKDFISITEDELQTALRAQITGKIGVFKNGSVAGNHIISIVPDYDMAEKIYNPAGPDYLPPPVVQEHKLALENASEIVTAKIAGRPPQLREASPGTKIYTKGPTAIGELIEKRN